MTVDPVCAMKVPLTSPFSCAADGAGLFPTCFRGEGGEVGAYFEAAGVIVTLMLLGS